MNGTNQRGGKRVGSRFSLSASGGGRRLAALAGLGLALVTVAASCGGGSRTLILVDIVGDHDYQDKNVTMTVTGGTSKTFHHATFTPQTSFQAGVYVPEGVTGAVDIAARIDDGSCVIATGATSTVITKAGETVLSPTLLVIATSTCVPVPGTGGSPSAGAGGMTGAGGGGGQGVGGNIVGAGTGGNIVGAGTGGNIVGTGTGGNIVGAGTGGGIVTTGTGGHIVTAGTGGNIVTTGTGGAGVTGPGCPIVQCPSGDSSCCKGWFSFAVDYNGLSVPSAVTDFLATNMSVGADFSFSAGTTLVRQIAAVGFDLTSQMSIAQVKVKATSSGPMPIYASFENPSGSARCLYAFNSDGDYLVTALTPVTGSCDNYPAGVASKINIRMDSISNATGYVTVSQVIIVP